MGYSHGSDNWNCHSCYNPKRMLMTTKTKWTIGIVLTVVCLACFALDLWGLYYYMFLKDNFTLTTAYVDDMSYSEEQKWFIEVQYFPNMFEVKVNYYTDVDYPEYDEATKSYGTKYTYSSGVQFDGGYQAKKKTKKKFGGIATTYKYNQMINCEYYNMDNSNNSYVAIEELADQNKWVYDIGGDLVLLQEKGNVKYATNALNYGRYQAYDFALMLEDLYKSVKSLEDGKRVVTFDLSDYFTFIMHNKETTRFEEEIHETTETWMYVNILVNKHSTDFVSAEQSMFNMFMGDREWSLYDIEKVDYWRARHEYTLGIEDFTFIYEKGGYYLKLQKGVSDFLSVFSNMKYIVDIDLDNIYLGSEKLEIAGFADKAFGSIGIDTINLETTQTREFGVYGNYNIVCPDNLTITNLEVKNV